MDKHKAGCRKEIPKESEKIDRQEKERQSIKTDSQVSKQIANTRSKCTNGKKTAWIPLWCIL